jgi:hypothetical protein
MKDRINKPSTKKILRLGKTALATGDVDYCQLFGAVVGAAMWDCRSESLPATWTAGQ